MDSTQSELLEHDHGMRDRYWATYGRNEPDFVAPLINGAFSGGPRWPNLRQAIRFVDCPDGTILASDGLADLFDTFDEVPEHRTTNGFGFELYLRTRENLSPSSPSWQLTVLWELAQQGASFGRQLRDVVEAEGVVSFELNNWALPNEHERTYASERRTLGILLTTEDSVVSPELRLSVEPIRLIKAMVLTNNELEKAIQGGANERRRLLGALNASPFDGFADLRTVNV